MLNNRGKLFILLSPSLISLVVSILLSIAIMIALGFSYLAGKGSIYKYLFGKDSSADLIATSRNTFDAFNNTVFGNAILNKILYFAFWMFIGLLVYIILYAILRGTGAAAEDIKEVGYKNTKRSKLLQDFAIRFSVRLAAIFAWLVFTILFIKVILPFCGLAARAVATNVWSLSGIAYGLLGFMVLVLSLHIEVVLMRLMALRVRLLSQEEVNN